VLVVDDDDAVRLVVAEILRDLSYDVIEVGSAGAAFDMLQTHPDIDLLLLDFAMPGMSGAEVARHVRARHPRLPILFVTGYADRTQLAGISEAQTIGKPFEPHELAARISAVLSQKQDQIVVGAEGESRERQLQ
jgi:CheY-like chemotaxis protein